MGLFPEPEDRQPLQALQSLLLPQPAQAGRLALLVPIRAVDTELTEGSSDMPQGQVLGVWVEDSWEVWPVSDTGRVSCSPGASLCVISTSAGPEGWARRAFLCRDFPGLAGNPVTS